MPGWFVVGIGFFAGALGCLVWRKVLTMPADKKVMSLFAGLAVLIGIGFTVLSSANTVPVRNVGIVTSFNKPTGRITGAGLQWVLPWQKIGEWDASRQKYDHLTPDRDVTVRTATLADAYVEVLIEWQAKDAKAAEQFFDYKKDFEAFRGQRVGTQLDTILNDAFATYNPLANIDANTGNLNVDLKPYADKVRDLAVERLGEDITIVSVSVVRVNHDATTEANIKAFGTKLAEGRNLDQDLINAAKRKAVTEKNAEVNNVVRCLEISEHSGTAPGLCINPGIILGAK